MYVRRRTYSYILRGHSTLSVNRECRSAATYYPYNKLSIVHYIKPFILRREIFPVRKAKKMAERETYRYMKLLSCNLKKDICNLGTPSAHIFDVESNWIKQRIPADVQYACLHWIGHLLKSGIHLQDNDDVHEFLQKYLLHWLEALSLMGAFSSCITAIRSLKSSINV